MRIIITLYVLLCFNACVLTDNDASLPKPLSFPIYSEVIHTKIVKLKHLLRDKKLPSFCMNLLKESKTIREFVSNWSKDLFTKECLLTSTAFQCKKKNKKAFLAALECYQRLYF